MLKQTDGKITIRSHFLRLTEPVKELETQNIAVAFALDPLGTTKDFDALASLDKQFKIKPAIPGRVAVFFTAEKETSRLRFHLHAPFVPELSRASIKETPANLPLFQQLASLTVEALKVIRNLGLLAGEFLAVLPNQHDDIPLRYQCIRRAIITAMNEKYLTPTYSKSHSPAKYLLQGRASLKLTISNKDLEFLVSHVGKMPEWAIGATQKNSDIDRFLNGLAIKEWELVDLLELLCNKLSVNPYYYAPYHHDPHHFDQPLHITSQEVKAWLTNKSPEWHQQLYALIYKELDHDHQLWSRLKHAKIVRLKSGSYAIGNKCFFPSESINQDDLFPCVDSEVYISGNSKNQQDNARKFLERLGVREVSEADQIEAILNKRYSTNSFDPDINDFQRFVLLVEKEPSSAQLFSEYKIFKQANGQWEKPKQIYLDLPYLDSGLTTYYKWIEKAGKQANCGPLSLNYQDLGLEPERILKFLSATGVQSALHIVEVPCKVNCAKEYLYGASGKKTSGGVDSDWYIPSLHDVINSESLEISQLIWRTMSRESAGKLEAKCRRNASSELRIAPSLLINWLTSKAWVPQGKDLFVRPQEATRHLLPDGFPFDPGWNWIRAIQFGEETTKRADEDRRKLIVAKELGFDTVDKLNDAKWFAGLNPEERERVKMEFEDKGRIELPDHHSRNPERRAAQVAADAASSPERTTEKRLRSVSLDREAVKKEADSYLRHHYTSEGEMICQVCKTALPFKYPDGSYYVEITEFLPELKRRHHQNYLALCPNHSAMFRHANGSRDLLKELFLEIMGNNLEVILAEDETTIYFTQTHLSDLRVVINADQETETGSEEDRPLEKTLMGKEGDIKVTWALTRNEPLLLMKNEPESARQKVSWER